MDIRRCSSKLSVSGSGYPLGQEHYAHDYPNTRLGVPKAIGSPLCAATAMDLPSELQQARVLDYQRARRAVGQQGVGQAVLVRAIAKSLSGR